MGKTIVITGAAGGIGRAITRNLALIDDAWTRESMFFLCDCSEKFQDGGFQAFLKEAERKAFLRLMGAEASVEQNVSLILESTGKIDVLINAAGVLQKPAPLIKTDSEEVIRVFSVNFLTTFEWIKAVLPIMRERGYGRIVNFSSVMGSRGDAGNAIYAASKAALESLTKTLALEAPFNKNGHPFDITVNAVAPGIIDTSMTAGLPEAAWAEYKKRVPFHRKGAPEEVAEAVRFLITSSQFINGMILPVDGGYLAS